MSTYPGENPQQPSEGQQPEVEPTDEAGTDAGTEPTQPVGYWERQAAEQARQQPQQGDPDPSAASGAVFNPTSAQAAPGWEPSTRPYEQNPYGQPDQQYGQQYGPQYGPQNGPQYAQPPYNQPGYGQQQPPYGQPYPQPGYGQPPYAYPPPGGQSGPPVGGPAGYPPYGAFPTARPDHPQSTLALVLGVVGLIFGFSCGVGFLASPFAWAIGRNAVKEIQASHGRLGGEGTAKAGMITGIVGTVLLVLGVLALIGFAILIAASDTTTGSNV